MMNASTHAAKADEFDRILALPRRPVVDCERERGARRWTPAAQALVEIVTERYAVPRLSCACRDRSVTASSNGGLTVARAVWEGETAAPPPLTTTIDAFCRDNAYDDETVRVVSALRPGQSARLKGLGYQFCIRELNPVQAWTLWELPRSRGIFGFISVGGGKSFLGILAPLALPEIETWVLLIKPDQRLHYRKAYLRLREHFRVPSIVFDDKKMRGSYIVPGAPILHVVPYSLLHNQKSSQLLDDLKPGGLIGDEVHAFSNPNSSQTTRWNRYLCEHNGTVFLGWSGSGIKNSIQNCAHISAHALGVGSPYPIPRGEVMKWSDVVDPSPSPDTYSPTAKKLRRIFGGDSEEISGIRRLTADMSAVREGHRNWVIATPGIISTRSSSITASITIRQRKAPPLPAAVKKALDDVRNLWVRPDEEELAEKLEQIKCAREIGAGYYDCWTYPRGESLQLIEEWFSKRKPYNRELRTKLLSGEAQLDSPALCFDAAARAWQTPPYEGELPVWPAETWPAWAAIADKVVPLPKTKWLDDYLARDAAQWALENRGIVWCQSRAFGRKVAELAGLPYHGGGPGAEERILAEDGSRSIIASIRAHGTGRDGLQFRFCRQLIADAAIPSGDMYEQLFGRLAREGQPSDTVETWLYQHVAEYREAFKKALEMAEFIEATTPNRQLLLAADIEFEV